MSIHERSKNRVKELGEVFTPPKAANQMIDMLDQDNFRDCRLFESTCGNGNILIEATKRRLSLKLERILKDQPTWSKFKCAKCAAVETAMFTFGADIMIDNVIETRERLMSLVTLWLIDRAYEDDDTAIHPSIFKFINAHITSNIQHADMLAGLCDNYEDAKKAAQKTKSSRDFFEKYGWVKIHFGPAGEYESDILVVQ